MKHSRDCSILSLKSPQSVVEPVVGVATEMVVDSEAAAVVEIVAVRVVKEVSQTRPRDRHPGTRGPSTLTFRLETGKGVGCTSNSGVLLIFVPIHLHARGKMFSPQDHQNNDGLTSSAKVTHQLINL